MIGSNASKFNRFPAFSLILIALYSTLQRLVWVCLIRQVHPALKATVDLNASSLRGISRVVAGLVSSSLSFLILNLESPYRSELKQDTDLIGAPPSPPIARSPQNTDKNQWDRSESNAAPGQSPALQSLRKEPDAGRTLDFTMLVMVRAIETLTRRAWSSWRRQRRQQGGFARVVEAYVDRYTDPAIFAVSAGTVM